MDSEESRPGSSASNSSSNSSDNSRQSTPTPTPTPTNDDEGPKSPPITSAASPQSSTGRRSRHASRSSNEGGLRSPRSPSKSDSDSSSSSSSSDNENDDAKSIASGAAVPVKRKSGSGSERSSSEEGSIGKRQSNGSRNPSASPAKSRQSSISHEDLSDVSDIESEKRASSFNNSKQSLEDEGTNASSVAPAIAEDEAEPEVVAKRRFSLEVDDNSQDAVITDLRQKLDQKKSQLKATEARDRSGENTPNGNGSVSEVLEDLVKTHDEDALDFEAEEGECPDDASKVDEMDLAERNAAEEKRADRSDGEAEEGEELEEGEVSDEDEKRPEETEPKPVCRFYTRGQCTWGMSCRFLHPGVTDKGNYTMFDLVRPVPVPQASAVSARSSSYAAHAAAAAEYHDFRTERPSLHHRAAIHHPPATYTAHHDARALLSETPVVVESAWERGLRTAKEMMRKANKRKEQDMDFEDKKMNLTLSPDELEKDPYYLKERPSPPDVVVPPPYGRGHGGYQEAAPGGMYSPPERFARGGPPVMPPYDEVDPYGRTTRYRELPPHRMPQYEDERRVRPTREVIVQRVEPVGRADDWSDPWMRSKSPGGRGGSRERGAADKRRRDRRSYSSNSSYSSSSSSQSDSSSDSSRSPSPADHRRRYNSGSHKSPPPVRRHAAAARSARSPSPPPRRSRHSPSLRHASIAKRRGHMSPSPALDKRGAYSPIHKRKKLSPMPKSKSSIDKSKVKRRHTKSSTSGSGSSDSSASDSDSSGSSSTDSSSRSKGRTPPKRVSGTAPDKLKLDRKTVKKEPPKKRSPISIEIKKQATVGASALAASPTHSVSSEKDSKKSRREELLKQLRAVEDAIAKKRSKLA